MNKTKDYSPLEEKINILSHVFGLFLSVIAFTLLVTKGYQTGKLINFLSLSLYGISLICLYSASVRYHSCENPKRRKRYRIYDHASIYVLIAGTYTPFSLITLKGPVGYLVFGISWSLALTGIILKLFFTGRFKIISTIMYVLMGWMILFFFKPLMDNLAEEGVYWLVIGGITYTVGANLYSIKKIKFNHAIFHIFVLFGSFCHFIAAYFYIE